MKILVVGGGGREHALAWKLAQEHQVFACPGNAGIAQDLPCFPVPVSDFEGILDLVRKLEPDLVVIGPEDPLFHGLADRLRGQGCAVFGPGAAGARLEGSKAWSKQLMKEAAVPTARFETFTDPLAARACAQKFADSGRGVVVKASGLALGKGVAVCDDAAEAQEFIHRVMVERVFGDAGVAVVVEERLRGPEFSLFAICSENGVRVLPAARDYKRAFDGDLGPNTGGMGAVSPPDGLSLDLVDKAERAVIRPILKALSQEGVGYRGVLFAGLLVQDDVPYCLEYNVRFGDPETQTLMMRLGRGLGECLRAAANGEAPTEVAVAAAAAATVIVASEGYPGEYRKGLPVEIDPVPGVKHFHAATLDQDGRLVTNGGRVVAASASGSSREEALALAYRGAGTVRFDGARFRSDIGS